MSAGNTNSDRTLQMGLVPGRVTGEHRTHFRVTTNFGELSAEGTGRLRKSAAQRSDLPGVGDFVAIRPAPGDGAATIEAVLPRSSALIRKAAGERRPQLLAANVDVVFIVTAPDGDFNLPRLERYLRLVEESGADPVIVLNKADLTDNVAGFTDQIAAIAPGVDIHALSARGATDIDVIEGILRRQSNDRARRLIGSRQIHAHQPLDGTDRTGDAGSPEPR